MTKGTKLGLILFIGAAAAGLSYYFLVWKPAHPKGDKTDEQKLQDWLTGGSQGTPPANTNTGSGSTTNPVTYPTTTTNTTLNGKQMFSLINDLKVRKTSNGEFVKSVNAGAFVGVLDGEIIVGGAKYYTFANKFYRVPAAGVRLA